jgi:hypothetical protein
MQLALSKENRAKKSISVVSLDRRILRGFYKLSLYIPW